MKARKVRQSTLDMISRHVDVDDIYITRTVEQSDQSLDDIIRKRYPLVLSGGGDGTAMRVIEQMRRKVERLNAEGGDYQLPKYGLLKLGTGNGWAGLLQTPRKVGPIWALRRLHDHELRFTPFNMMESEGRLFHFGGMGVDALILNDYIDVKNKFTTGFMWKVVNSLLGYLIALIARSIPKTIFKKFAVYVKVTNLSDEPVYRINHTNGVEELPIKKGEVIYDGRSLIAGFATTENYGFNLKAYPFACVKPGYCQLRLADVTVPHVLRLAKTVWIGTWEEPGVHDFLVKHIRIESKVDVPFQLGGDPEGYRRAVEVKVSDYTVEMLDFRR
jgi:diacylglycerol kinase family enzyme